MTGTSSKLLYLYRKAVREMNKNPEAFIAGFEKTVAEARIAVPTTTGREREDAEIRLRIASKQLEKLKALAISRVSGHARPH